jgi:hypothetical protein
LGSISLQGETVDPEHGATSSRGRCPDLVARQHQRQRSQQLGARAQIDHGLLEAGYGYWGFSPANVPEGGYEVYGVDGIGMNPDGYPSNEDRTLVDSGFPGCPGREPTPPPPQSAYTNGVVTPHAAFLGLRWAPGRRSRTWSGCATTSPTCTGAGASATA